MRVQTFLSLDVLVAVLSANSGCFIGFDINLTPYSLKVCLRLNLHSGRTRFPPERGVFPGRQQARFTQGHTFPLWRYFNKRSWRHGLSSKGTPVCTAFNRMASVSFLFNQNIVLSELLSYLYAGNRGNRCSADRFMLCLLTLFFDLALKELMT